jgi:proteasome accessory factor B
MAAVASKRRDRQVVRILGILGTLLEGRHHSILQLAAQYGTRRETIYRDIRALQDAGYPIVGDDSGLLSHPRILPEARRHAPELRLADSEIAALLWAGRQAGTKSPFRDALSSAKAKLRAMASAKAAVKAAGIDAAVIDGGYGAKDYSGHRETIMKLVEAIVRNRRCAVEYQSPAARTSKRYQYEAYRLLSVDGGLYCIGKIPAREGLTTLAVDRIRTLTILDAAFEVDPDFDPDKYRRESFGIVWERARRS